MAIELLETLKEAITTYSGLSPNALFTVVAVVISVYYIFSILLGGSSDDHRPCSFEEDVQPLLSPVQLGEITEEELKAYDGNDSQKPLLMAIKGQIYDVSQSRMFYGPGGQYALFVGKDASRALAKMFFDEKDLNGDLTGLGAFELDELQDWEYKIMSKYVKVGSIKKPEGAPKTSVAADHAEPTAADPTESNAAEPSTAAAAHVSESTNAKEQKPKPSITSTEGRRDE